MSSWWTTSWLRAVTGDPGGKRGKSEAVLTPAQRQRVEALRAEGRSERVVRRVAHMRATLGLSDAQGMRVERVFEQTVTRRQGTTDNAAPAARRAAREAQHQAVQDQLRQILTPAQMEELAAERAERRSNRGSRGESRGQGRGRAEPKSSTSAGSTTSDETSLSAC